ncbi:MAG: FAD-dependent oxidoreductase [Patescibacteria group bacterium]
MIFQTQIIKRELVAEGTMSFYFKKPDGFIFKGGQYADFTLVNPSETDTEGNSRSLSLASAPYENELMITTRLRNSAFKRVLQKESEKVEIKIDGPFGSFTLQKNTERPAVFLMGGIGITPARSIILQVIHDLLPHQIYLFYSNRRPEDAPFLEDFWEAEKINPNFKFVPIMTGMEKSKETWTGESEYIIPSMLQKYLPDFKKPIYYAAGPMTMTNAMREILNAAGIDDDDIRSEEFSGY